MIAVEIFRRCVHDLGRVTTRLLALGMAVSIVAGFALTSRLLERDNRLLENTSLREVFAARQSGLRLLRQGWALPEAWGTWSVGPRAELAVPLEGTPADDLELSIEAIAFPHLPDNLQSIHINVNGTRIATLQPNFEGFVREATFSIPGKVAIRSNPMQVVFEVARPTSPSALGLSSDSRRLGIGLKGLTLFYRYELRESRLVQHDMTEVVAAQ
jgi:hypothetical protein